MKTNLELAALEIAKLKLLMAVKPEFRAFYVEPLESFNGSYADRASFLRSAEIAGHLIAE